MRRGLQPQVREIRDLALQVRDRVSEGLWSHLQAFAGMELPEDSAQAAPAVDLLLCDESNPRSVAYQVVRLREENRRLPQNAESDSLFSPLDRALMRLLTDLRLAEASEFARTAADGRRTALRALLDSAEAGVAKVDDLLSRDYLDHAPRAGVVHALVTEV